MRPANATCWPRCGGPDTPPPAHHRRPSLLAAPAAPGLLFMVPSAAYMLPVHPPLLAGQPRRASTPSALRVMPATRACPRRLAPRAGRGAAAVGRDAGGAGPGPALLLALHLQAGLAAGRRCPRGRRHTGAAPYPAPPGPSPCRPAGRALHPTPHPLRPPHTHPIPSLRHPTHTTLLPPLPHRSYSFSPAADRTGAARAAWSAVLVHRIGRPTRPAASTLHPTHRS